MSPSLYTATGCARCKITKRYMLENHIGCEEYDIKAEGKEAFAEFYRAHRSRIYRSKDGVEFPVYAGGEVIRQGVGAVIGYLVAGKNLSGFIRISTLHGEWIDGFDISGGNPEFGDRLLRVLAYLKKNNLKVEVCSDGHNSALLQSVLEEKLADRAVIDVKGPTDLYARLSGRSIAGEELKQTIALAVRFPEYRFYSTIAALEREDGTIGYLSPEEIGIAARLIETATGSKKHPYRIRACDPAQDLDDRFKAVEPLPSSALFKYRTAARWYMVMTEIER